MPYFCNKTDALLDDVTKFTFDKTKHYEGEFYFPGEYPDDCLSISDIFWERPFHQSKHPDWLYYMLDREGYMHTATSVRDYRQGRLTKIKLGKFVTKFFPGIMSAEELTEFVSRMTQPDVKFGTNFRDVYERSHKHASSCMAGKFDDWRNSPLDVYDGGDLQIAYTENAEGDITNRAIVWPEKMIYQGLYGNSPTTFARSLQLLGYKQENLTGARLKFLTRTPIQKDYLLMPYIDGDGMMSMLPGGQLIIGSHKDAIKYWHSDTNGYVGYQRMFDEINSEYGYPHEMVKTKHPYNGNWVYVLKSKNPVIDPWGYLDCRKIQPGWYRENMYPRHFLLESEICDVLGIRVSTRNMVTTHDNKRVSFEAIIKHYRRCCLDNQLYPLNEMKELINGNWIHYPDAAGSEVQPVQDAA